MRKLTICAVLASLFVPVAAFAQQPLQPPPPIDPATGQPVGTPVPAQPPTNESSDSGIGLEWVWANAEVGASYVNMKSFDESQLAVTDSAKSGAMFGFGAGVRLLFLTIGLRARHHTGLSLWQINGEVGFHMKFGRIDPYLVFRGGYDSVGSFSQSVDNASGTATVDVHGWNAGAGFGIDVYLMKLVSIGGELSGDLLFLKRPPSPLPGQFNLLPPDQQAKIKADPLYQQSGSSVGFGGGLTAHVGIHF